jgi:hypothetical protein
MKDIKFKCILLSSGPSWYTIVMIILSSGILCSWKLIILLSNRKNAPNIFDQVYIHYLHNGVCQIGMSDLMMNAHTWITHSTTYTILYVRSVCLIWWWMDTHVLLITLLTPCCMSDQNIWINNECTHLCYW